MKKNKVRITSADVNLTMVCYLGIGVRIRFEPKSTVSVSNPNFSHISSPNYMLFFLNRRVCWERQATRFRSCFFFLMVQMATDLTQVKHSRQSLAAGLARLRRLSLSPRHARCCPTRRCRGPSHWATCSLRWCGSHDQIGNLESISTVISCTIQNDFQKVRLHYKKQSLCFGKAVLPQK